MFVNKSDLLQGTPKLLVALIPLVPPMSDGIFMLSLSLSSCLRVSDPSTTVLEVTLVMAQKLQCRRIARSHWWRRHDAHKAVSTDAMKSGQNKPFLSVFMSCSEILGVVPYAVTRQMSLVLEGLVRVGSIRACPNRSPVWLPSCGFFPLVELCLTWNQK